MEKRMYFLVHRSLSAIQKGIQSGHVALRYARKHRTDAEFWDFVDNHETFIVLDGGVNIDLIEHENYINNECGVSTARFDEPDLNNCMTSLCFIIDERVFDRENYPNFPDFIASSYPNSTDMKIYSTYRLHPEEVINAYSKEYKIWVEKLGGEGNVKLREFLSQFKLAI